MVKKYWNPCRTREYYHDIRALQGRPRHVLCSAVEGLWSRPTGPFCDCSPSNSRRSAVASSESSSWPIKLNRASRKRARLLRTSGRAGCVAETDPSASRCRSIASRSRCVAGMDDHFSSQLYCFIQVMKLASQFESGPKVVGKVIESNRLECSRVLCELMNE
jgi:hypothetical protein